MIQVEDLRKSFPMGDGKLEILHGINLQIPAGDYVAIMGPSGSGKTTLMNLLGFLDTPTSGRYRFDEVEAAHMSDNAAAEIRNQKIGFVFQQFNLLPKLTALENVALPLSYQGVKRPERLRRAAERLTELGLEERLNFYPRQLSGGQCQRVAIARAMVTGPRVLLADEPTGALDSKTGKQIMALFEAINREKGTAIVLITHDAEVASYARQRYHMQDGYLTAEKEMKGGAGDAPSTHD